MKSLHDIIYYFETRIKEPFYSWAKSIYNFIQLRKNPERLTANGKEYPDKTFYYIDIHEHSKGFASYIDMVFGYMEHADRHGWIPVVGITDPVNNVVDKEMGGNAWEYYFKGIFTKDRIYRLSDIHNAARVVMCNPHYISLHKRFSRKEIQRRNRLFQRLCYNEDVLERFTEAERRVLTGEPTIGVYYRGTDYGKKGKWNPVGHPKVMDITRFTEKLLSYIEETGCRRIFFVTEEQEALDYANSFMRKRGITFHYIPKARFSNYSYDYSISSRQPPSVSCYENNLLYLLDIDVLSKCDYLFGPLCSGIQLALNMNGNHYRDVHILYIGRN